MKSKIIASLALILTCALVGACDSPKNESAELGTAGEPPNRCEEFIRKLEKCDPTASDMSDEVRQEMLQDCPESASRCAELPVETNAQCSKFMGCLYDE
ncbi:hypothetical protein FIV42_17885 [Persicimonas caeni]|uniref:Lipoprotein n=1 Tax=Persicimonas caeni TaxID=2292766 RepID=A0A4Y6PWZ3_PERCE|nr:hypothetical protein [Persicimonas caeni]QDG52537.1 hypothetical protein FIV42_17885 [Persicimonas caeni]QED33759.1 hypothetical protein FRD00_17880 [Persicimonas caeni]